MKLEKFAVIGHPIKHTMSPFIHRELFALSGVNIQYDILDIENVLNSKEKLLSYDGLNVTIPHKQAIMEILFGIDEKAKRYSSVNTVKIEENKAYGYTTDGIGAFLAMGEIKKNSKILILGNGGAARAIAFELENVELYIAARNKDKAKILCDELKNATALSLDEVQNSTEKYDILINATSVGMYPNMDASPASENLVSRCETVFDIVYNPQDTKLINMAKALNKRIVYGMDMLVYQAVAAHGYWYGAKFNNADITKLIENSKQECIRLFGLK